MVDNALGARHASTLDGTLLAPGDTQLDVAIVLDEPAASSPVWQAATWLLCELVNRGTGHASTLTIVTGDTRALLALPGVAAGTVLGSGLVARSASIGGVYAISADTPPPHAITVRVGPGQLERNLGTHLEVFADNWAGGVRTPNEAPHLGLDEPTLLIGALIGACHAAAALFRHARLPNADHPSVWHDAWALRLSTLADAATSTGPTAISLNLDDLSLAGMGAVGNAFALTALTHPGATGTLRAADYDHVDFTNLNRCLLFVRDDLDQLKADVANAAAAQLNRPGVTLQVAAERAETAFSKAAVTTLVSAVDTNRAREAINRLVPRLTLAGSTWQLRVQTNVFVEPGPCLRCFNPPEPIESDRSVKARVLGAHAGELIDMAARAEETTDALRAWASTAGCGELDAKLLPALRHDDEPTFSVGFVSVLSGVLLAATAIRTQYAVQSAPTIARAQLFRPASRVQQAQPAQGDLRCPACGPGSDLPMTWRQFWG